MAKITAKGLSSAIHHVVKLLEYVSNAYGIPLCTYEDESCLAAGAQRVETPGKHSK